MVYMLQFYLMNVNKGSAPVKELYKELEQMAVQFTDFASGVVTMRLGWSAGQKGYKKKPVLCM